MGKFQKKTRIYLFKSCTILAPKKNSLQNQNLIVLIKEAERKYKLLEFNVIGFKYAFLSVKKEIENRHNIFRS